MASPPHSLFPAFGTGTSEPAQAFTNGRLRWEIDPVSGALVARDHTEPATTIYPQLFFRVSGGKWQACVKFPTGAMQILVTEP